MIFHQTFANGLFLIVFTGGQIFAGDVIFAFHFRRIKLNVVNAARGGVYATTHNTVNDQFVRYVEFQHVIHHNTRFFHRVSLRDRARETVQQKTVTAVFLGDTLFNQRNHQFIGHQFTGVHDIFRLFAQLGA